MISVLIPVHVAFGRHDSSQALHQKVVARVAGEWPLPSKCRYLAVNEVGFDLLQCVVVDLEGIEDVRTVVDRHDVGLRNKPVDDRLTFF